MLQLIFLVTTLTILIAYLMFKSSKNVVLRRSTSVDSAEPSSQGRIPNTEAEPQPEPEPEPGQRPDPDSSPPQPEPESPAAIRMLSLNACVLAAGVTFSRDGKDMKDERLECILNWAQEYDVTVLQEVWGSWWTKRHTTFYERANAAGLHVVHTPCGATMDSGNVILTKRNVRSCSAHVFSSAAGWQRALPNGVLHACVDIGNEVPLHVFTTHLHCNTFPYESRWNDGAAEVRAAQIAEMRDFMQRTVPEGELWLATGDFNVVGKSSEYRSLADTFGCESLLAPSFPPTFNCDSFLAPPEWRTGDRGIDEFAPIGCLDHVFTTCDVSSVRVVTDKRDISDHFPVEIIVKA